jgi:hypothetical protein
VLGVSVTVGAGAEAGGRAGSEAGGLGRMGSWKGMRWFR